jgi:hypothetical protein
VAGRCVVGSGLLIGWRPAVVDRVADVQVKLDLQVRPWLDIGKTLLIEALEEFLEMLRFFKICAL